jgi:hypothetical protein
MANEQLEPEPLLLQRSGSLDDDGNYIVWFRIPHPGAENDEEGPSRAKITLQFHVDTPGEYVGTMVQVFLGQFTDVIDEIDAQLVVPGEVVDDER